MMTVTPDRIMALTPVSLEELNARAGFQTIGRRKGYYPAVGGREDGLVMSLAL